MKFFADLKHQINRVLGTSFDDEATEAEVVAGLEKIKGVDEVVSKATSELSEKVTANAAAIATLQTEIANRGSAEDVNALTDRVASLENKTATAEGKIATLETQVSDIAQKTVAEKSKEKKLGVQAGEPAPGLSKAEAAFQKHITNSAKY